MDETELVYGSLSYQRRIVSYFDILGWRENIEEAGVDPRYIARLADVVRTFAIVIKVGADRIEGAHLTSFSDNVVASVPFGKQDLSVVPRGLASIQLGLALRGFWVRGAVTIGDLHHDEDVVFGPALNRAYELESKLALYPRIILDPAVQEFSAVDSSLIASDEQCYFIDSFKKHFLQHPQRMLASPSFVEAYNKLAGTNVPTNPSIVSGHLLLPILVQRLDQEIAATEGERAREKLFWLRDRIESQYL